MVHKTLLWKLQIEQNEPHYEPGTNSSDQLRYTFPVLLILKIRDKWWKLTKGWHCDFKFIKHQFTLISFLLLQQNVGKEISPRNLAAISVKKCLYRIVPTIQTRSDIRHICQDRHIVVLDLIKCYTVLAKGNCNIEIHCIPIATFNEWCQYYWLWQFL